MTDNHGKLTMPWIPVGHPDYKWTSGADVQATWRKYGWTPPSERMTPPVVQEPEPSWVRLLGGVR